MNSESVLEAIVQSASDGFLVFGPDYKVTVCNPAAERMLNTKSAKAMGSSILDAFPALLTNGYQRLFAKLLAGKHVTSKNLKHKLPSSFGELTVEIRCSPERDEFNRPLAVIVAIRSSTDHKNDEMARTIINTSAEIVTLIDPKGTIIDASEPAVLHLGYNPKNLIGSIVYNAWPKETVETRESFVEKAISSGKTVQFSDFRTGRQYMTTVQPLTDAQGIVRQLAVFDRDVTEYNAALAALAEERLFGSTIVDTTQTLVVVLDPQGHILRFNRACEECTGYTIEEIWGRRIWDTFVEPRDINPTKTKIETLLSGSNSVECVCRCVTKNNQIRLISWANTAIRASDNRIKYIVSTGIDITEHQLAEDALRKSEQHYRSLLEGTSDASMIIGLNGTIHYVTPSIERVLGFKPEDLLGENAFEYIFLEGKSPFKNLAALSPMSPMVETEPIELRIRRPDGGWRTIESVSHELRNDSEIISIITNMRDITDRKMAEKRQGVIYRIAEASNRAKNMGELFTCIHQEIQTLLDADSFYIALFDHDHQHLTFPYFVQTKSALTDEQSIPTAGGANTLAEYSIELNKATLLRQPEISQLVAQDHIENKPADVAIPVAWLGAPLRSGEQTIGLVAVQHYLDPTAYSCDDLNTMEFVSGQIGLAIERKRAEEALRERESSLRLITDNMLDMISRIDETTAFTYTSPSHTSILGYNEGELIGKFFLDYVYPDDQLIALEAMQNAMELKRSSRTEFRFRCADGHYLWLECVSNILIDAHGSITGAVLSSRDVTERKMVEELMDQARDFYLTIFDEFPGLIWRSGPDGLRDHFNSGWLDYTGHTIDEEYGDSWTSGIHPDDLDSFLMTYDEKVNTREQFEVEYRLRRHDGEYRWMMDFGRPYSDLGGAFAGYIGACLDITPRKKQEQELGYLATHDPLTDLRNRRALEEAMPNAVVKAKRGTYSALLFLDLDEFKQVNDSFGHQAGDQVLTTLAQLLKKNLRTEDLVVRMGGDEFAILMEGITLDTATTIAERIRHRVSDFIFTFDGHGAYTTVSIGITFIDGQYDAWQYISQADNAMYLAKEQGRNRIVIYNNMEHRTAM